MAYKTYFNWSSGKDSALALYHLLQDKAYIVEELVTTINSHYNRVTMHGLRLELLKKQTEAIGINTGIIELPEQPSMDIYNEVMAKAAGRLRSNNFTHAAFGDIFLEDLRNYRDDQLSKQQIKTVYPLWKKDTKQLISDFLNLGFKTIVVSASARYFDKNFVGTIIDKDFIDNLPHGVDPCGENGEFHTFCFGGPIFNKDVSFSIGEKVYREYNVPQQDSKDSSKSNKMGYWYVDLIP